MTPRRPTEDPFGAYAVPASGVTPVELSSAVWRNHLSAHEILPFVERLIDATGLPAFLDEQINAGKVKPGRPASVPVRTLLIVMLLAKIMGQSPSHTALGKLLHETLSDEEQERLGVRRLVRGERRRDNTTEEQRHLWAFEARIGRLVGRVCEVIDPSPWSQPRSLVTKAELETLRRSVDEEDLGFAQVALDTVTTRLLAGVFMVMPRRIRRQWRGDISMDDTPLQLFSRHRGPWSPYAPFDPDGGWYDREGRKPTSDRDARSGRSRRNSRGNAAETRGKRGLFGLELSLVTACDATTDDKIYFPTLPLAFTAHRPGTDPAGHARRVIDILADQLSTRGTASADRLYPHQDPSKWHRVLRQHGWSPVFDYRVDMLGRQGSVGGAVLVEGAFYCPMMGSDLIEATVDLRAKRITIEQYQARIKARNEYRLRVKQQSDEQGDMRMSCPAAGSHPIAVCDLKHKSTAERLIRQPDGTRADTRREIEIIPSVIAHGLPDICAHDSIKVRATDGEKFRQPLIYGSKEHTATLRAARQAQEGLHGLAKGDVFNDLGSPGSRRKRGIAAQSLYAAMGLAVTALRKVIAFMREAQEDENGLLWVPRRPRSPLNTEVPYGAGGGYLDADEPLWPPGSA